MNRSDSFMLETPSSRFARRAAGRAQIIGCALLVAWVSRPTGAASLFAARFLFFDTGHAAYSVTIGDLNGDGKLDLVTANPFFNPTIDGRGNTVSVQLGYGDGTFGPATDFDTGNSPSSVAIGDLNGDGKPDLATANQNEDSVSVLLGNGDGTFGPNTDYGTDIRPFFVAIGDLNGDSRPDLVTANSGSITVSVLLGNGDGTFGPNTEYGAGNRPFAVAIGDLNGDSKPDLVTANNSTNTVSVLLGNGDGTFGEKTDYGTGPNTASVAIGDLNGDGKPDLVTANHSGSRTITVLLGNGDGTFRWTGDYNTAGYPWSVAIGDLNGDGKPDLAAANGEWSKVSVLLGNGDGTFSSSYYDTGSRANSVAIGDLNGDGKPDLATANGTGVSVLRGNGDGTFGPTTEYDTGSLNNPYAVAMGDLNGDGKPDLVTANYESNTASVLLGNGDGTFRPSTLYGAGTNPTSVAIGDLSGDSKADFVTANRGSNTVSVRLGNGDGTFGASTGYGTGTTPYSVAIGDLNGDGKPDLVTANRGSNTVSVLLGTGDGTFGAQIDYGTGPNPSAVAIGDLNGDGKPDLVTANRYFNFNIVAGTVSVLLGNGDGTFGPMADYATGDGCVSVAIGDLNGDGKPDLAAADYNANNGSSRVSVLLGNGDGTFGARSEYVTRLPNFVAIGDLNGDGKPDLVAAVWQSNMVSVLPGNGDGTFGPRTDYGTGASPLSVAIGDLNGDGKPDLVTANFSSTTVSVLLHTVCAQDADCNDHDLCTDDSCDLYGMCVHVGCNDDNTCTTDVCNPATGCIFTDNTNACDDGNACTTNDTCGGGVCHAGAPCNDDNPCTMDTCDPARGCVFSDNTGPCDDGDACTTNDTCGRREIFAETFDGVTAPTLPEGWTSSVAGIGQPWVTRSTSGDSAPNSVFGLDSGQAADETLASPAITISSVGTTLTFRSRWSFENSEFCYDAGVLEIKIGDGSFEDIVAAGGSFVSGGYTGIVEWGSGNPLTGRAAWCNVSPGYPYYQNTEVTLPATAAGQTVQLRWRLGSDNSVSAVGQDIDSIVLRDPTICHGGPAPDCDDNNPCTDDSCDTAIECVHDNNSSACDDGDACTVGDTCGDGTCHGGPPPNCDDADACTTDHCDSATGCRHAPVPNCGNHAPVCTGAIASPPELRPPNYQLTPMSIGGVTDADGDQIVLTVIAVNQDEPVGRIDRIRSSDSIGANARVTCPDARILGPSVLLRAERDAGGDGRVYRVSFSATDGRGGTCEGTVLVCVPNDQRGGQTCIDSGRIFDSTGPCVQVAPPTELPTPH